MPWIFPKYSSASVQILPVRENAEKASMVLHLNFLPLKRLKARRYELWGVDIYFVPQVWQGQKDLNPRHAVLETAALPTELYP